MNEDGTVVVQTGATEIGTGSVMAGIAQIVAGEMGVRPRRRARGLGRHRDHPDGRRRAGQPHPLQRRATRPNARPNRRSGELLRRAADILEAAESDLEVKNGRISVTGVPDRGVTYADLTAGQMWVSEPVLGKGAFVVEPTDYDVTTLKGSLFPAFNAPCFHCHAAEVEVDPETGSTRVVDFVVAQDVGFAVTPTLCRGTDAGRRGPGRRLHADSRRSSSKTAGC